MNLRDVNQFHADLEAAMVAGIPLEFCNEKSGRLTLEKLKRFENLILPHFAESNLANDDRLQQICDSYPELPPSYCAALRVFNQTGTMVPVLDGFTQHVRARQDVTRSIRWSFLYLLFLVAIACLGLAVFWATVYPLIHEMRVDKTLSSAVEVDMTDMTDQIEFRSWLSTIVIVLGCGMFATLVWMICSGISKVGMWLGGTRYVRSRLASNILKTIQMLVESGMPVEVAVDVSCDLACSDLNLRTEIQAVSKTPQHIPVFSEHQGIAALQRLAHLKVAIPVVLVSVVGGGVVLVYCLLIFGPIVAMLRDLGATAGI